MKDPESSKAVELRLHWYGHKERRDGKHLLQKARDFEVAGKRRRGRQKQTMARCVKIDMDEFG